MTFTAVLSDLVSLVSKLLTRLSTGARVERRLGLAASCAARPESPLDDFLNAVDQSVVPNGAWFVRWSAGGGSWLGLESAHLRLTFGSATTRGPRMLQTGTLA